MVGGSYSGMIVATVARLYPGVLWAAYATSALVEAIPSNACFQSKTVYESMLIVVCSGHSTTSEPSLASRPMGGVTVQRMHNLLWHILTIFYSTEL